MKRLSINARITLWYGAFLVLIVGMLLLALALIGSAQIESAQRLLLKNSVDSAAGELEFENGVLDVYDDDIHYYRDNIFLSVYDNKEQQLGGYTPGVLTLPPARDGEPYTLTIDNEDWLIYDVSTYIPEFGSTWMRGCVSLTVAKSELMGTLRTVLLFTPLFLAIVIAGGYLIVRKGLRPIGRITDTARSIQGGRDLSRRIHLQSGAKEFCVLADTFDGMFDTLESAFEAEKQFTADASHELKTPIAAILAQSESALEAGADEKKALAAIHDEAAGMSALVSQLLLLAKADNADSVLNIERMNLSELCETIVESLRTDKVDLSMDIEPNLYLSADQTMMMRLMINLIENAIHYTDEGGKVNVGLKKQADKLFFSVSDNGIGIDEEHLEDIFRRFCQLDPSRHTSGAGLGLPMARWIANRHGGTITVESKKGEGSTFTVTLPTLE